MYTEDEFKVIAWDGQKALPMFPINRAMYVVKDGPNYKLYFTDSNGNYLTPIGVDIDKTSDISINDGQDGTSRYIEEKEIVFTEDLVVALGEADSFGKYRNGDIIPATGKTPKEVIEMSLSKTLTPTIVEPSLTLTTSITSTVEVGETVQNTVVANFNRGVIRGRMVGGVWNPNSTQNPRAGEIIQYVFAGINNGLNTSRTIVMNTQLGANTVTVTASYSEGPQPKDSLGQDYLTPLPAGSITESIGYTGSYKRFYGALNNSSNPRALNFVYDNTSTTFDLNSGTTQRNFHIYLPPGRELDKVLSVEASNADITSQYVYQGVVQVPDAGGVNRSYRYYKMTTDAPYSTNNTHRITIKNG